MDTYYTVHVKFDAPPSEAVGEKVVYPSMGDHGRSWTYFAADCPICGEEMAVWRGNGPEFSGGIHGECPRPHARGDIPDREDGLSPILHGIRGGNVEFREFLIAGRPATTQGADIAQAARDLADKTIGFAEFKRIVRDNS